MSGDQSVFAAKEKAKKNIVEIDDAQYILESKSSNHIRHLSTQLTQLRENSQLCDAVLVVKGARMKAHRVVLAACSNYFKAMFTADMAESCSPHAKIGFYQFQRLGKKTGTSDSKKAAMTTKNVGVKRTFPEYPESS